MRRRIPAPLLIALSALAPAGAAPAAAAPAERSQPLSRTVLYHDAGRAAEYTSAVSEAVDVWNTSVGDVRLEPAPAGRHAEIASSPTTAGPAPAWGRCARAGASPRGWGVRAPPKATTRCASPRTGSATAWACPTPSPARARR
ncbi:hypothetical protein GCM10023405_03510 [Streptomonospora salina]